MLLEMILKLLKLRNYIESSLDNVHERIDSSNNATDEAIDGLYDALSDMDKDISKIYEDMLTLSDVRNYMVDLGVRVSKGPGDW